MVVFGVLLPSLIAWGLSGWLAKKLRKWWGTVLSVIVGFVAAVVLSATAHGLIADYLMNSFEGEAWLRATGTSIGVALLFSVWSVVRARRSNA